MSDDQVLDVIDGAVDDAPQDPPADAKPAFSLEDWQHAQEEKASASGWKPFDEYVSSGGDPTKWKTADAFNVYGEMIGTIRKTQKEFDQRLEGVHKLSQAQLAAERARLQAERDNAIDDGDKSKVHALDKQINSLNVAPVPQSNSELDEWNAKNPWIFEDSPKTDRAHSIFTRTVNAGKSVSEAIAAVEADIAKHFSPKPQQQRAHIPESEKGRGSAGFGKKTSALTMSDLTREEQAAYHHLPGAWKDEKEFLQAVADDRKAAARG